MAAPAFGAAGTYLAGTAANSAVAYPASVGAGDILLMAMYIESTTAVTPPGSWVQKATVAVTGVSAHTFRLFWIRATGGESGTVTFTHSSAYRECMMARYTGCVASGDPFDTAGVNTASSTTPSSATPAVTLTTGGADELLVWYTTNFDGGTFTAPSGFNGRHLANDMAIADLAQTVAGSTGSLAGTGPSAADGKTAALGALLPAATASPAPRGPLVMPGLAAIQAGSW